ncbi:MAG: transketolase, partial [Planctomycetales bacterium]
LVFSDYCRPSLRLAALMELPILVVFTHDSVGVGEDGPTHQPIEHLAALRTMPGMLVMRPGDANEVAEAWRTIMPLNDRPVSLILTRQALPTIDREKYASAKGVGRGAYVVADAADGDPEVLLLTSGSELSLCLAAHEQLTADGVKSRVVSMPCWELFEDQDEAYRNEVLPPGVTSRVAVEMACSFGWAKYIGFGGKYVTIDRFGASAPGGEVAKRLGFTVDNVVAQAKAAIGG